MGISARQKTLHSGRAFKDLQEIYEKKGSLAAWNFAFTLVKIGELHPRKANDLMREVVGLVGGEEG